MSEAMRQRRSPASMRPPPEIPSYPELDQLRDHIASVIDGEPQGTHLRMVKTVARQLDYWLRRNRSNGAERA